MDVAALADLIPHELCELVDRIGNTPLATIFLVIDGVPHTVYLKMEGRNPAGSVKDRTAYALVHDLENRGLLRPSSTIVESTSGNLGVSLSLICRAKGYSFIAVVDSKTTYENIFKMRRLGAQIEVVSEADATGNYLAARLERVQELCRRSSRRCVWTNQYDNPANPQAHYSGTGPEIYRQMNGRVDAIFVPVSTGGTLAGIARYFREVSPATILVGVDARGSVVFGGVPGPRKLTGIGSARPSSFITPELYDVCILVGDTEAFAFCKALFSATELKVGGSSGAALAACAQYLHGHPDVSRVVCVCPDGGENYDSTIFNENWLCQQGIETSARCLEPVQNIGLINLRMGS